MSNWTHSIRHPWFTQPSMKRKPSAADIYDDDSSSDTSISPSDSSPRRRKRVKYSSLERGLAHMSLNAPVIPPELLLTPLTPKDVNPLKVLSQSNVLHHVSVVFPSSIEEPSSPSPESEPIDMDIEPELVTSDVVPGASLSHPADDWKGTDSGQFDIKEMRISSVVLERLGEQNRHLYPLIPLPSQTSQALVLYRPPLLPCPSVSEGDGQLSEGEQLTRTDFSVVSEVDAMDVE